jgi:hypothetical protein
MNYHFEPINYIATIEINISTKSELLDFLKIAGYNNKWNKILGETLLDHLNIEQVVEAALVPQPSVKKDRTLRIDDMPF